VYGVYNATGPASRFTVRQMLEGAKPVVGGDARFTYVTAEFLAAQDPPVRGWGQLPVWLPPAGGTAGFTQRSIKRALDKGLTFRPYAETVRETLAFYNQQPEERKAELRAGIAPEREREVLAAWHARGER
jgi:2'-hydroxyisoflavone reductase